eukprot:858043-Ditylum_brightwellii.AAC.1
MQDIDTKSKDKHKVVCVGQDKEDGCGVGGGSKKQKIVFDNLDDEDDNNIVQTKLEIDKCMELALTVPSKYDGFDILMR